jgi:DNA mismatch repair protein PMS2
VRPGAFASRTSERFTADLEELIHLLHDRAPGQIVRPAKVRSMFAMRACRKSVMVGKALTLPQMTGVRARERSHGLDGADQGRPAQIIRRMEGMKEPWSCPHGRPTMRWLAAVQGKTSWHSGGKVDWTLLDL